MTNTTKQRTTKQTTKQRRQNKQKRQRDGWMSEYCLTNPKSIKTRDVTKLELILNDLYKAIEMEKGEEYAKETQCPVDIEFLIEKGYGCTSATQTYHAYNFAKHHFGILHKSGLKLSEFKELLQDTPSSLLTSPELFAIYCTLLEVSVGKEIAGKVKKLLGLEPNNKIEECFYALTRIHPCNLQTELTCYTDYYCPVAMNTTLNIPDRKKKLNVKGAYKFVDNILSDVGMRIQEKKRVLPHLSLAVGYRADGKYMHNNVLDDMCRDGGRDKFDSFVFTEFLQKWYKSLEEEDKNMWTVLKLSACFLSSSHYLACECLWNIEWNLSTETTRLYRDRLSLEESKKDFFRNEVDSDEMCEWYKRDIILQSFRGSGMTENNYINYIKLNHNKRRSDRHCDILMQKAQGKIGCDSIFSRGDYKRQSDYDCGRKSHPQCTIVRYYYHKHLPYQLRNTTSRQERKYHHFTDKCTNPENCKLSRFCKYNDDNNDTQ